MTVLLDVYFISAGTGFAFIVLSSLAGGLVRGHGSGSGAGHSGGGHAIGHSGGGHAAIGHSSAHMGSGGHAAMGHSGAHSAGGHAAMGESGAHSAGGHAAMGESGAHSAGGHAAMGESGAHSAGGHAAMGESGAHSATGDVTASEILAANLQDATHVVGRSSPALKQSSEVTSLSLRLLDIVNPTKWALRAFLFGAVGALTIKILPGYISLIPAIVIGWLVADMFLNLLGTLVNRMYSSTNFSKESLIGSLGELTISIPAGSTGEVVVSTGSSRYTSPAKASSPSQSINNLAKVVVVDIKDGTFIVEPFDDQNFLPLTDSSKE